MTQGDEKKTKRTLSARAQPKKPAKPRKKEAKPPASAGVSAERVPTRSGAKPSARRGAPPAVVADTVKRPSARPRPVTIPPPPPIELRVEEALAPPPAIPRELTLEGATFSEPVAAPVADAQRSDALAREEAPVVEAPIAVGVPGGRASIPPSRSVFAPPLDGDEGAILITGICGRLGKLLTRTLHRQARVVGVDRRSFPDAPRDVVHHRIDLRRKKTKDVFRQHRVRAVVHLGVLHDPRTSQRMRHSWNVVAFQKLLEYMTQYRVPKLVVLSSANVYGPQPDNPQFLTEEAPLLGSQEFGAIRDLIELDMLAQSFFWRHPETETVILRPCHILGRVHNAPSNYLRLERPITVMGFDPMVQVIHEADVVGAVERALEPGVKGIFNLRGPGELPLSRLFAKLGRKPRAVPGPIAESIVDQMWRLRLSSFPSPEIDHIRYLCMVDDTRARNVLGYAPKHTLDQTLEAVLD